MTSTMRKWVMIGMGGLTTLSLASPAFAKTIRLEDAGLAFWIFVVIGTIIILLQLVPAAILFFSFIGTTTALMLKRRKAKKEKKAEAEVLTEVGSAKVK